MNALTISDKRETHGSGALAFFSPQPRREALAKVYFHSRKPHRCSSLRYKSGQGGMQGGGGFSFYLVPPSFFSLSLSLSHGTQGSLSLSVKGDK